MEPTSFLRRISLPSLLLWVACALPQGPRGGGAAPPDHTKVSSCAALTPAPAADRCATIADPGFASVDLAGLVTSGALTAAEAERAKEAARQRDVFEARRLGALCQARVQSPCDGALALALDSAVAAHRAEVDAARADPAESAHLDDDVISAGGDDPHHTEATTGTTPPAQQKKAPTEPIERFPRIIAPSSVAPKRSFTVLVGLTMHPTTASAATQVIDGATSAAGAMVLELPPLPEDVPAWKIDVLLVAPSFTVSGDDQVPIELPRVGDSTLARFTLSLDVDPGDDERWIGAYLFHDGAMIGQIGRSVAVERDAAAPKGTVTDSSTGSLVVKSSPTAHDIELIAFNGQQAMVVVAQPGLQPSHAFVAFDSAALGGFLAPKWGVIRETSRGIDVSDPNPQGTATVRGLGLQLWELTPAPIREHLLAVWDDPKVDSLRIFTNVPAFPWELVQPQKADGTVLEPLGNRFRIGRWHLNLGPVVRPIPPDELPYRELVAVMPTYGGATALPALVKERQALAKVKGFRQVDARVSSMNELVKSPPDGIVHFAGHGIAAQTAGASTAYAIRLEDGDFDALAFRGLPDNHLAQGHTLVFFNACDVGQASTAAGLVEGWAPAVLDAGASGYIGALWPVGDAEAADFAATFYGEVERSITSTGQARVTDVLRCLRQRGVVRQDPTWQAYVFYGDPDTSLLRDGVQPTGRPYTCPR